MVMVGTQIINPRAAPRVSRRIDENYNVARSQTTRSPANTRRAAPGISSAQPRAAILPAER